MTVKITYDKNLVDAIASSFALRKPNHMALDTIVHRLSESDGRYLELIADLATGVGKTYLMSAVIDYLAEQGVRHILVVTPGSTIQKKTLGNFDAASHKFVSGAENVPFIVTPENFRATSVGAVLRDRTKLKVFVFNVQQLIQPTTNTSRKVRNPDENLGGPLYEQLKGADDLFVIADEQHVYRDKAEVFSRALRDLDPAALVGLTATPDRDDYGKVVFQYTLGEAIADGFVKTPVIVYRNNGTKDERTQLADACQLLQVKSEAYRAYESSETGKRSVRPVLFVVCESITHAEQVSNILAAPGYINEHGAVLQITSQSSDEALEALAGVERPESPIRAIVSVNMLREGWDVKNIAVIVALRKLASSTLTEQILGRGLRLPYGSRTGVSAVDEVDLVAHDSYEQLLKQKDSLTTRLQPKAASPTVDQNGAALVPTGPDQLRQGTGIDPRHTGITMAPQPGETGELFAQPGTLFAVPSEIAMDGETEHQPMAVVKFKDTEKAMAEKGPVSVSRTQHAPDIVFPQMTVAFTVQPFTLSMIANEDAAKAGQRFREEVTARYNRDKVTATRDDEGKVSVKIAPDDQMELVARTMPLEEVRNQLAAAVMDYREVPREKSSRKAAQRIVGAFMEGAGSMPGNEEGWSIDRTQMAAEGLAKLIADEARTRPSIKHEKFHHVRLPREPVIQEPGALDAYNSAFIRNVQFTGWKRSILPVVRFDAETTEWNIAKVLDRDSDIAWWMRVETSGEAYIPLAQRAGRYFPDFIAIDKMGEYWLIEGKSDDASGDADVLEKKKAAIEWARKVNDSAEDEFGTWHYLFATETHLRKQNLSWAGLRAWASTH